MSRSLCRGMAGQDVRALHDALNFHIRRGEPLRVDGIFGPKTDARVREFQRANRLTVDGLAGPRTQAELCPMTSPIAGSGQNDTSGEKSSGSDNDFTLRYHTAASMIPRDAEISSLRCSRGVGSVVAVRRRNAMRLPSEEWFARRFLNYLSNLVGHDAAPLRWCRDADSDREAVRIGAQAFCLGREIFFSFAAPALATCAGQRLLAHEAAHAWQRSPYAAPLSERSRAILEAEAESFAFAALAGRAFRLRERAPFDEALAHAGPPCPREPQWVPVSARLQRDWLTANLTIEHAYKDAHPGNMVLLGSDFARMRTDIQLPRGAQLSGAHRAFADKLLRELRGISNQLQPDIIDFTKRAIYEIKSYSDASANVAKVTGQLESYYKLTDAIALAANVAPWSRDAPTWYPPHSLRFAGDPRKLICTECTMYVVGRYNSLNRPGLILYQLLQKQDDDEERKKRAQLLQVTQLAPEIAPMADKVQSLLRSQVKFAADDDYLILTPRSGYDALIRQTGAKQIEQILRMLQVPAMDVRQNPVIMLRLLGWTVVGVGMTVWVIADAITLAVGGALALGAAGAAEGPGALPLVMLRGLGQAANDNARILLPAAAGVLFTIGTTNNANAASGRFDSIDHIIAAPANACQSSGEAKLGAQITFLDKSFIIIGHATTKRTGA